MERGFGVGALVVAILGVFVPVVTIYVIWFSLILASIAAVLGDKIFSVSAVLASFINIVFLSPLTLMALKGEELQGESTMLISTIVLFIAPILSIILFAIKREKKPKQQQKNF